MTRSSLAAPRPTACSRSLERHHGIHPGIASEYAGSWHQGRFLERWSDDLLVGVARRVEVLKTLFARFPDWDLCVLSMGEAHTAGHQMWHGVDQQSPLRDAPTASLASDRLVRIHQAIDRSIGEIRRLAPPETTTVVFSVKGMEADDVDVVAPALAPELLHRLRFGRRLLRLPSDVRSSPGIGPPILLDPTISPTSFLRLGFADSWPERWKRRARHAFPALAERHRRGSDAEPWNRRALPSPIVDAVDPELVAPARSSVDSWHGACWYRRHWPVMEAFVIPSFSDLHLRINLVGRERHGIVPSAGYLAACERVATELRRCTDARSGRPAFGAVTRLRVCDPGARDGPGADLVVESNGTIDAIEHPDVGVLGPLPFPRVGSHTARGFAWMAGLGIAPGPLGTGQVIDLAPTICALLDVPPHTGFDGRSLRA